MRITARTLFASVLAASVLGGAVGALATAATSSQASPQAIAAQIEQVQDQKSEKYLRTIGVELLGVAQESQLARVEETLTDLLREQTVGTRNSFYICWDAASLAQRSECER
jgi:hypothetical protein